MVQIFKVGLGPRARLVSMGAVRVQTPSYVSPPTYLRSQREETDHLCSDV